MFLLRSPVLRSAGDFEADRVAPEGEAARGVGNRDRRVIDAQEQLLLRLPARVALARGVGDQLEIVLVGVAEVERDDAAGGRIPVRQALP